LEHTTGIHILSRVDSFFLFFCFSVGADVDEQQTQLEWNVFSILSCDGWTRASSCIWILSSAFCLLPSPPFFKQACPLDQHQTATLGPSRSCLPSTIRPFVSASFVPIPRPFCQLDLPRFTSTLLPPPPPPPPPLLLALLFSPRIHFFQGCFTTTKVSRQAGTVFLFGQGMSMLNHCPCPTMRGPPSRSEPTWILDT